ncbi:GNAT family N-acetyltransferase [Halopiger djelfimassiliensis]|uniref:GNAT family N-acetyltransferase n=1 Tax=Halopiger djelfimassiliensis TaxID=1293047 RepID=UPI000677FC40|nr:GNAT family N-acetyltransferase [Halopiger djelfimassiliensis]
MAIREATVDDIEAIQNVAQQSWTTDYPEFLSRDSIRDGLDEWYAEDRLRDAIAWTRALVLVAERDGGVVGFAHATWNVDATDGTILRVYVAPDHRTDGFGTRLLEETCRILFEQGVDRIEAMVLDANELGKRFYREFGFEKAGTEPVPVGEDISQECTFVLERETASDAA